MEGLREGSIVLATTAAAEAIDPALRRPGATPLSSRTPPTPTISAAKPAPALAAAALTRPIANPASVACYAGAVSPTRSPVDRRPPPTAHHNRAGYRPQGGCRRLLTPWRSDSRAGRFDCEVEAAVPDEAERRRLLDALLAAVPHSLTDSQLSR